jgi:hypothetical protein
MKVGPGSNENLENDDVTWMVNCVRSDLVREAQCDLNFFLEKVALTRNVLGLVLKGDVEVRLHGQRNLMEVLPLERDSCKEVFVQDELHCDNRREDNVTVGRIVIVEDTVDNNVVDIDDEEDGEHDCEVVYCSDLRVQNVDTAQREDLVEPPRQHVLHSLHQGTSPLVDECVLDVYQW